jgi:hypothetical protein
VIAAIKGVRFVCEAVCRLSEKAHHQTWGFEKVGSTVSLALQGCIKENLQLFQNHMWQNQAII